MPPAACTLLFPTHFGYENGRPAVVMVRSANADWTTDTVSWVVAVKRELSTERGLDLGRTGRTGHRTPEQAPDPEPDEGLALTWRLRTPRHWCGSGGSQLRGTVTLDSEGWLA